MSRKKVELGKWRCLVRSSYARMNPTDLENLKKPLQLPEASDMPDELR